MTLRYAAFALFLISVASFADFWRLHKNGQAPKSKLMASVGLVGVATAVVLQATWTNPTLIIAATGLAFLSGVAILVGLIFARQVELPKSQQLTTENSTYRSVMSGLNQGVIVYDAELRVVECNREALRILRVSRDVLLGNTLSDLDLKILKEDESPLPERRLPSIVALRSGKAAPPTVLALDRAGGTKTWLSVRAHPLRNGQTGEIEAVASYIVDVTREKGLENRLYRMATEDPLTGLKNRRALEEELRSRKLYTGKGSALLILDLDNFKLINDMLGHASGDEALIRVSRLFESTVRPNDVVARLGGDEFVILLKNVSPDEAQSVAEKVRQAVARFEYRVGGHRFHLGVSIGLTMVDKELEPRATLMFADAALQEAKQTGKNKIVVHRTSDEEGTKLTDFNRWATRIKDALEHNRFELHFQPIVSLDDESVRSFEALLRMRGKSGNLFPPEPFLSAAEYFNLMPEIDEWVVERALEVLQREPDWKVFVNLSGSSLSTEALLELIHERVREIGLTPGRLVFEVTETVAVANMARVVEWIHALQELGCEFALDDFGSGFSSFTYLHSLPIDFVKIDGSYVSQMHSDPTSRSIVQSITGVCHAMGKQVIAEWVENGDIVNLLRDFGVEYGQGFHWGHPRAGVLPEMHSKVSDKLRAM